MRTRRLTLLFIAATAALQAGIVAASPDRLPALDQPWMLAVGDSITYGWTVDPSFHDASDKTWAAQVRDQLEARGHGIDLYQVACPGETTQTYMDGGCIGRKLVAGLQGRSQHEVVADAIASRGNSLRLIVVELGTNDYFHARSAGGDINAQLDAAAQRLRALVDDLKRRAPGVPIVVAGIYDPHGLADSWDQAVHLDTDIAAVARQEGAGYADFLHAVTLPLALPDDRCRLIDCAHHDIHPTLAGQTALAGAVLQALPASLR